MAIRNTLLLFSVLLLLLLPYGSAMSEPEMDSAISALHYRGYNLFGNSITASDVRFELLRPNASFTLFAPTDTDLYNLGAVSTAVNYTRFLRRQIALGHHNIPALRHLHPSGAALPTLLPQRSLHINHRSPDRFLANGVEVVAPGIFEGPDVVVHGLADGIFSLRQPAGQIPIAPSPFSISAPISAPEEHVPASGLSVMLTSRAPARLTPVSFLTSLLWSALAPAKIDQAPWTALDSLVPLVAGSNGSWPSAAILAQLALFGQNRL